MINILNLLREEKILADAKDLTAFIKKGEHKNRSLSIVKTFCHIENFLLGVFEEHEKTFHLKQLNEDAGQDCKDVIPYGIKTIINFWAIKNWVKRHYEAYSKNNITVLCIQPKAVLKEKLEKRHALASFIVEFLYDRSNTNLAENEQEREEVLVEFSVHELKEAYENRPLLFDTNASIEDIEDTLFYLSRIDAIKIEGGFLVIYNRLSIKRLEQNNRRRYKEEDYEKLNQFYENKIQQIHIVGEYAKKMVEDYQGALQFVDDYFQLNYTSFLHKYFPGSRQGEIKKPLTPTKFRQLFEGLTPTQTEVIHDNRQYIAVIAGPGKW